MGVWQNFVEKIFPTSRTKDSVVIVDIPASLYYKELAIHTAASLISNAISRAEIKCFVGGKPERNNDYYLLNVSPNRNEGSSVFWHKVINKVIRAGEALVVDAGGYLYCADSYTKQKEQPILGDIYAQVTTGNFTFGRTFTHNDYYRFTLDNINVKQLIDGMYDEYGKVLTAASKAFRQSNGQKYKIHIEGVRAGDKEFRKDFDEFIKEQIKQYVQSENAIYPEFDGYTLEPDKNLGSKNADDYIKLKNDLFQTVAGAFHIPESMMTGNITSMKEIVGAFLTFGVDPYADMISETLNKRGGVDNYAAGNYYVVDTSRIQHRDIFDIAAGVSALIGSGVYCIDETREEMGKEPLGTDWSQKHFITKNFEEIDRFLKMGGETNEKKDVLPGN